MATKGCGTPLRGSGKDLTVWKLEWTYTDGSGAVLIDSAQSDEDPGVATPVADGGEGLTNVTFPRANRAWVLSKNLSPGTPDTEANFKHHEVVGLNATAGTAVVRFITLNGTPAPVDPSDESRYSLILLLERP